MANRRHTERAAARAKRKRASLLSPPPLHLCLLSSHARMREGRSGRSAWTESESRAPASRTAPTFRRCSLTRYLLPPNPPSRRTAPTPPRADRDAAIRALQSTRAGASAALAAGEETLRASVRASASADAAPTASTDLLELNSATFWPFVKEQAGDALVVVDFFTTWCGPCKLMMPKLAEMATARGGRMIAVKFECNAANKDLGKELGVRSVPTFQLYKGGERVATMTGAKPDDLEKLIDEHM